MVCKDVFDVINQIAQANDKFLVNNVPQFYLKTNVFGVYYWSGSDVVFDEKGIKKFHHQLSEAQLYQMITTEWSCNYILTAQHFVGYNTTFDQMLQSNFWLVCRDKSGLALYRKIKNDADV